ncbi:discoidin domain-containing protein [Azospirillum doebereinerae]|uniref:Discoidin domain-containing protein n=1 Tax=Azospirillum doebereinerae TaxID=92933 RepID=A0A3S0WUE8_9PROT|nr:discoidin domain-containing protein [Azospirillum doebereinerae]RUQ59753.1 discoidin domain-containing protein [Azospirillum doebereinerae]
MLGFDEMMMGASMTTDAQYWRLFFSGAPYEGASGYVELFEVEFFTTADASGANENSSIYAITASSAYSGFPASNAIDGNTSTTWSTADNSASNSWIAVDFNTLIGSPTRTIRAVAIYPKTTRISPTTYLEASTDNATWLRVATLSPASTQVRQVFTNLQ